VSFLTASDVESRAEDVRTGVQLPDVILHRIEDICVQRRFPAFLRVTADGNLAEWGGACERYGLASLQRGLPVAEQVDFLEGMLPLNGDPVHIPLLQLASDIHIDLRVFPVEDEVWVLLLDATEDARQRFEVQQNANELTLLREKEARMLSEIRGSHGNLLAILDQLRIITAITDPVGRIEYLSAPGRSTFEVDDKSPAGCPWHQVFPFGPDDMERLRHVMSLPGSERERVPVHVRLAQGREYWMEVDVRDDPREEGRSIFYMYDVSDVHDLRRQLNDKAQFHDMIGRSNQMEKVFRLIEDVAPMNATVLIQGDTGTGKELVARAIHASSPRHDCAFVVVNCAGLSDTLINSELFGHRKGAFTDAKTDQAGLFEAADGGTIFLDEIGDIPMNTQTRILRVLEEKEVVRIGETQPRKIDIRILAATNKDLNEEVRTGRFRNDLLYRIRVARVNLPPLRERREDIPLLIEAFLREARASTGKPVDSVSTDAMHVLMDYAWPGNVRELRNAIAFAVISCRGSVIQPEDLPPEPAESLTLGTRRDYEVKTERERIRHALEACNGRRGEAAKLLGISRATLYRRIRICFPNAHP